ncbi:PhzF family phenazine biosynthesis protein [Rhodobium gokarnense]|uniref:Trans-2,3-dihydro-3-hydroxyanthranilate isomerase n=1 Tax=Rhodobium gokarnense TaxID=364296 RepID=A0ABT3H9D7_9HYPH|nr:PhzF family phenazine biosynthesis protein [Rhodobium gokarnense]MCW2306979.1 trans-2,3-dihydro-3-hydroxyanthranilate isomerase [Rhodobium gokarnense]
MPRAYAVLDVFTDTPLAGNPLAVVLDAEGLEDDRMQAIAREFNLSETVFVLPPENPAASAKVRIFTPAQELPFAGHPTVGTAVLLATDRFGGNGDVEAMVVLEETVGPVRCGVRVRRGKPGYAEFDVPKLAKPCGEAREKELIAAALSLEPREIGFENHKPSMFDAGVPYTFVPVSGLDAIARAHAVNRAWPSGFGTEQHSNAFLYCRETLHHDYSFHARMFGPIFGIREDPATGSAVAAFAGVVKAFDGLTEGTHLIRVEQGYEMGRPSRIDLEIDIAKGALKAERIGGKAVIVARGTLEV